MKRREIYSVEHAIAQRGKPYRRSAGRVLFGCLMSANIWWKRPLIIACMIAVISSDAGAQNSNEDYCLVREGRRPVVGAELTALYEHKLFVTKDDIARYVFLTNGRNDGDRSAAVYRVSGKAGSLSGDYWITSTEASTSLADCIPTAVEEARVDLRSIRVRRTDAPIPATTAKIVHELWVKIVERSRIDKRAVPFAPTGIFAATMPNGVRLGAVTAWQHEHALCDALVDLGESLIYYAKLPPAKRAQAAVEIEEECNRLLKRVKGSK